ADERLATVRNVTVAVPESGCASVAAPGVLAHAGSRIRALSRAHIAARAAVGGVAGEVDLAAVAGDVIAVSSIGETQGRALRIQAVRCRVGAHVSAGATILRVTYRELADSIARLTSLRADVHIAGIGDLVLDHDVRVRRDGRANPRT